MYKCVYLDLFSNFNKKTELRVEFLSYNLNSMSYIILLLWKSKIPLEIILPFVDPETCWGEGA